MVISAGLAAGTGASTTGGRDTRWICLADALLAGLRYTAHWVLAKTEMR